MKNGSNGRLTLEHLKQLFPGAVLLPTPLGKKGPMFRGWQKTTYEGTKKQIIKNGSKRLFHEMAMLECCLVHLPMG